VCSRDDHLKGFGLTCTHICPLIMNVNYRVPVCLLCLAFGPKAFIIFFFIFFFFFFFLLWLQHGSVPAAPSYRHCGFIKPRQAEHLGKPVMLYAVTVV